MKTTIRRIGNSQGIILPKPILSQLNFGVEVELSVEDDAIILRSPRKQVRLGWEEASKLIAKSGERGLVWPEFPNKGDAKLKW